MRRAIADGEPFVLVSLADKLHNARSIRADVREFGPVMFERFTAGRDEQQLWPYRSSSTPSVVTLAAWPGSFSGSSPRSRRLPSLASAGAPRGSGDRRISS